MQGKTRAERTEDWGADEDKSCPDDHDILSYIRVSSFTRGADDARTLCALQSSSSSH